MSYEILWIMLAVFLYILCAILLVIEIFVPSFGLLTVLSLLCLAGGIALFFKMGVTAGYIGIFLAIILIPAVLIIVYRIFPKTSMGKKLTLQKVVRAKGDAIQDSAVLQQMLNRTGIVVTPLRPVGMCEFDGQKLECVSESGYIPIQKKVKIIHIEGTQLTVRAVETEDT